MGCAPELLAYVLLKFEKKDNNITHFILQWSKYSMHREKWANSKSHGAVITHFWDKSFNTTLTYAKRIRNTDNCSQSYFSAHLAKIPFALCSWTRWRKKKNSGPEPHCQRRVYIVLTIFNQYIHNWWWKWLAGYTINHKITTMKSWLYDCWVRILQKRSLGLKTETRHAGFS